MGKILSFDQLETIRNKNPGKKIVHCHGVFDLFHFGHLQHLNSARSFGDILVVTVTPDRFVNKGPGRPRYFEQQRAAMLASLELVDYVVINSYPKAIEPILALQPHYYVKGPDYFDKKKDITGGIFEEEDAVTSVGGELVFTADDTLSSTELLNRYFSHMDENQQSAIDQVKSVISLEDVITLIESFARLKVLVVGEPIVDTYVFCNAEGISSKSPSISARFESEENYAGGSLAIANHLRSLGCEVGLLIADGAEEYFERLLAKSLDRDITLERFATPGFPTPRKTRFLTHFRSQRIFELMHLRSDQWRHLDAGPFVSMLHTMAPNYDLVIIADYGHGLFEGEVLQSLGVLKQFIALNVQTNSGNLGFNPFTKHQYYDYLSIDERELRFGTHDRLTPVEILANKTVHEMKGNALSVTIGATGSLFFDAEGNENICPTFFKEVVDTTGAGDAYLAVTALLAYMRAPSVAIPFLGNCFAGLKTRIVGNKNAVSKIDYLRSVQSILR
jgi:rfaE bifunctional protein nucleotidyltransferase chain/domain